MKTAELDELLVILTKHRVRRYAEGDLLIVLGDPQEQVECGACGRRMLAKVLGGHRCDGVDLRGASTSATTPAPDADACPCSHSRATEHNHLGCCHGCPHELCASKDGVEPPEDEP